MIAAVFVLMGLAWQAAAGPELQKLVEAGLAARRDNRHQEAIAAFRQVAELAPGLAAAHVNLGDAYFRAGQYANAIAPLKRALELNPELPGASQMLGYALVSAGYAAEAIPYLEKAQATDLLGIAQYKAGRLAEAVGSLSAALAKRPQDPDLLFYLGRAAAQLSQQSLDTLQAAHPGSPRTLHVTGDRAALLRRVPEAEKAYREALRLRPATPGVHLALGDLYTATGKLEAALTEYRAEAELQPGDPEAAYKLGQALLQAGKAKEARAQLEHANTVGPGMPETLFALGKASQLTGDSPAAERAWLALLELEKDSALAAQTQFSLAAIYRAKGEAAKADAALREFRRLQPAGSTTRRP